tara:strand:- start:10033 stop:10428 length:396 start_codon:yes stop_codon:yes gene_type:complete
MISINESIADFIVDTKLLLNCSLTDFSIKSSVELFGYDEVKLSEAKSLLLIFEELCENPNNENVDKYQEQNDFLKRNEVEDGQKTTQMQDEILDLLSEWVSDYKKIVKIALKDKPHLLEKLGLFEKLFQDT